LERFIASDDGVDLLAPRIGYKEKREEAYNLLAENPTQVSK
jgi:hypothetical protein